MKAMLFLVLVAIAASTVHAGSTASCTNQPSGVSFCNITIVSPSSASFSPIYSAGFNSGSGNYAVSLPAGTTSITFSYIPGASGAIWNGAVSSSGNCNAVAGSLSFSSIASTSTPPITTNAIIAHSITFSGLGTGSNCVGLQAETNALNVQTYLFDITVAAAASGDPQIYGMQGQEYQIHGTPDDVYNMVSTSKMQLNAHFVFLSEGVCDNFTACFTHPGTYIDIAAFTVSNEHIRVQAGSIKSGLRLFVNEVEKTVSSHLHKVGSSTVLFSESRKVEVSTPELVFSILGSDHFMNIESGLVDSALMAKGSKLIKAHPGQQVYPEVAMHGLLGQTWKNVEYTDGSSIEGSVADYLVQDGLYGSDFTFNQLKN